MENTEYDALVIGSGAAGSFAAWELTRQGLTVLMLEAGRVLGPQDFDPKLKRGAKSGLNIMERVRATLAGQHIQARAAFFRRWQAQLFIDDRKNPYTTPKDAPFIWIRGRQRGGRLHSFGRVLMRWSDDDFRAATRRGEPFDWPIGYDDIAPFYAEVEQLLGLYGNADGVSTMPDGVYAHPSALTPSEQVFKARVETAFPGQSVVGWRYMPPDAQRLHLPLRAALETGRLTLLSEAVVSRILTDPATGRATGAEFIAASGQTRTARARSVVLCASPIESVRLLLNSANAVHPQGLGNGSGTLGRYFMDQLPSVSQGRFTARPGWARDPLAPGDDFYDPTGGIFLPRAVDPAGGTEVGRYAFQGVVGRAEVAKDAPGKLAFFGFGEMRPAAENRITLDPGRRDAWGIPAAHIACRIQPPDRETLAGQVEYLREMLDAGGAAPDFIGSPLGLREWGRGAYPDEDPISRFIFRKGFRRTMVMGAAIHESGGARMGASAGTSVLNRWNQSWEVPNLFVTDASAFVTGGVTGTTLTVMALTLRACRHLAAEMAAGRL